MVTRNSLQALKDTLLLPIRALALLSQDRWGLSSLASDRFYYAAKEVTGYCLDVGCGPGNRFINEFLSGNGHGIDVYPYEGLTKDQLVDDLTRFPFAGSTFNSVTFIANFNHIPQSERDAEVAEAYRCLKDGGNIIVTMANPICEIVSHKQVHLYDRWFGTRFDLDSERGMHREESYYVLESEIYERLEKAGFENLMKKRFLTQWGLNYLIVGWKQPAPSRNGRSRMDARSNGHMNTAH